ncbi:MAG: type III secretion system cytoplasmic ring protein SctQ [Acidobacteriaceae bacterium]|nr:type III secretion system cytoplasmic ring protein SctQ [Acidobacteriaceae bacterium]
MTLIESKPSLSIFEGLKPYSKTEVELINCFKQLFHSTADWPLWIQEGLGSLLEAPGQPVILLQQANQVEPGEMQKLAFQKDEVIIGREQNNDIVIPLPGVGRRHARITKNGAYYILEDLGSANGTYLNDTKLNPHESVRLSQGDRLLIFPHQFTFSSEETWRKGEPIRVASGLPRLSIWNDRRANEFTQSHFFNLNVSPGIGSAVLGASLELLKALVNGISRGAVSHIVPSDSGLFEFLVLSILQRANSDLQFPFRFSLAPFEEPPESEPGIEVECVVSLTGATGVLELFLPSRLLGEVRRLQPVSLQDGAYSTKDDRQSTGVNVSWPLMAICGHADLSLQEMEDLEVGDVLLIDPDPSLLLPAKTCGSECGWHAELAESEAQRLKIEEYFERRDLMTESQAATPERSDAGKPNLATLPVRVHIVLSQLEMTLAELNRLTAGSIIELNRDKSEAVLLAVNGKIAGAGELVEIEGRVGVRISNWAA